MYGWKDYREKKREREKNCRGMEQKFGGARAMAKALHVRSGFVFPGYNARCKSSSHRSTIEARCLNQGIQQQPKREILLHVNKSEERGELQREAEGGVTWNSIY